MYKAGQVWKWAQPHGHRYFVISATRSTDQPRYWLLKLMVIASNDPHLKPGYEFNYSATAITSWKRERFTANDREFIVRHRVKQATLT